MNIEPHIPKIPKPKLMLLFSILIALIIGISIPTIQVYATDYNGDHDDSGNASGRYKGGPTYARTGWLLYLVTNDDDEVVSDVVFMSCNGMPQGTTKWRTRIGDMNPARPISGSVPWASEVGSNGAPFDNNQHSNESKIKKWMLTDDGQGTENWYNLVKKLWSEEKAKSMDKEGYSLIMEPVYWANVDNMK